MRLHVPLSSCLLLLLIQREVSADTTSRRLGAVTSFIDTGKWLEFDTTSTIDSFAVPCSSNCSNATSSQALNTIASPWTYTSTSCTKVTVLQGYETGDTIYQVTDGSTVLGNTTQGTTGTTCGDDPTVCFADSKAGRLTTSTLAKGDHSLKIQVKFQTASLDGGWFQINTTTCPPTAPSKSPTKSPSSDKCISALNCAKYIRSNGLCGCKKAIAGSSICIRKKATNRCCSTNRPGNYVQLVLKKFKRLCTKGVRSSTGGGGGGSGGTGGLGGGA